MVSLSVDKAPVQVSGLYSGAAEDSVLPGQNAK